MAGELRVNTTTGKTVYFTVWNFVGQIARTDGTTHTFEAYQTAHRAADYSIAATEQGSASGVYLGTMPSWIAAGDYVIEAYIQAGGSPAEGDVLCGYQEPLHWSGSVVTPIGEAIPAAVAGASGGLVIAGSNAATTFATLTSTGAFTINGTSDVAQTGDSYARLGAPAGVSVSADIAAIKSDTGTILTDVNTGAGAIYTRLGAPAGASMSADIAAIKSDLDAGVTVTTNNDKTGYALTSAYDFAKGTVAMTESYAALHAAPTPAQALLEVVSILSNRSISGTTLTAKKLDGTTSAMTFTLDSATTPTSQVRAS